MFGSRKSQYANYEILERIEEINLLFDINTIDIANTHVVEVKLIELLRLMKFKPHTGETLLIRSSYFFHWLETNLV